MEETLVRLYQESDLAAVKKLLVQLSEVTNDDEAFHPDTLDGLFLEMSEAPKFYLSLVATSNDQVTGFLSMVFYKTFFHEGGTALINELVIDRRLRGKGIGQALVARAKEEALARGMDELEVGTEFSNQAARSFYQTCGFDQESVLLGMEFE